MKSLIKALAVAAVLAVPVVSFAQSSQPVTRAQVRAELVQLEKAGYVPSNSSDTQYPANSTRFVQPEFLLGACFRTPLIRKALAR